MARVSILALVGLGALMLGAGQDNNVEWAGVSHIHWLDRTPRCPVDGEGFTVALQTYHYDLTAARVYVYDGVGTWVEAEFSHERGVYDVWTAEIPATAATTLYYYFELTDGTDTDYLGPDGMSDSPPASGWTLNYATLSHAPLGGTVTSDGGAVFKVWAPGASTASVAGQFNGWSSSADPMAKASGCFTRRVDAPVYDGQEYKYVFNGGTWKPDARGRALNPSNNNNTYLVDPAAYEWADGGFVTPPFEEMVIYELHVGTFSGKNDGLNRMGTFRDIVDTHLDHLLYLGVNAVELMPVNEFDYYESWGYNPISNWAPENAYGSPEDLKYVIDVLHQNGIAVLLDVVYNHFSYSGNFMWYYDGSQSYFDDPAVSTPWGSQADFDRQEVREYFVDNVLQWLEEYHFDGFRMDATRYMRDNWIFPEGQAAGWSLMQWINDTIDARKIDAISIAEELPNDTAVTTGTAYGGAGFDSQWHDQWGDSVRQEIFDAAYGDPEMWRIESALKASDYPNKTKLVRYVESHDEADDARLAVAIDGSDAYSVWARGRSKLVQGLTVLVPGIPMFLMGGEWLEAAPFGSGWDNRIDWAQAVNHAPMTLFFRDVIGVRKSNCGLRSDANFGVYHVGEEGNVIAMWRGSGQELVVVANFGNTNYSGYGLNFPHDGTWYEILNSQASAYDGNGWGNGGAITVSGGGASIVVPQMGLLVFRYEDAPGRNPDIDSDGDVDLLDYAWLQQGAGWQGCGLGNDLSENGRVDEGDWAVLADELGGPN